MDLTFESRKRRQVLSALSNPLTFVTVVTKILISIILIIQAGTLEVSAADTQNDDFYQCGARVGLDAISPGVVYPRGDIPVGPGSKPFWISCHLNPESNYYREKGVKSDSLVFLRRTRTGPNSLTEEVVDNPEIVNATTVRFLYRPSDKPSKDIVQCQIRGHTQELDGRGICLSTVLVLDQPKKPLNFSCVSNNWMSMNCTWIEPWSPSRTRYTLEYLLGGRELVDCPSHRSTFGGLRNQFLDFRNGRNRHIFRNRRQLTTSNPKSGTVVTPDPSIVQPEPGWSWSGCYLGLGTTPSYRYTEQYKFLMKMENALNTTYEPYPIDHYSVVRPAFEGNLTVVSPNSTILDVSFRIHHHLHNFLEEGAYPKPGIKHRLRYKSHFQNDPWKTVISTEVEKREERRKIRLEGLIPYGLYTVKVDLISGSNDFSTVEDQYLSKVKVSETRTLSERPSSAPETTPGAFQVVDVGFGRSDVFVYWKGIPERSRNGPDFAYAVTQVLTFDNGKEKDHQVSQLAPSVTTDAYALFLGLDSTKRYQFYISSINHKGHSKSNSRVDVPSMAEGNEYFVPRDVTKVDFLGQTYQLSWTPPRAPASQVQSYTVFWCLAKNGRERPYQCDGQLDWKNVGGESTAVNLTVPTDGDVYQMAVSANLVDDNGGVARPSGMAWSTCTILHDKVIGRMKPVVIGQRHARKINVRWNLECLARAGLITGYRISYCPVASDDPSAPCLSDDQLVIINAVPEAKDVWLEDLQPWTHYKVAIAMASKDQTNEPSEWSVARTRAARPESSVDDLEASLSDATVAILTWKRPERPNGRVSSYRIKMFYQDYAGRPHQREISVPGDMTSISLPNLEVYTRYSFDVITCVEVEDSEEELCGNVFTRIPDLLTGVGASGRMHEPQVRFVNTSHFRLSWPESFHVGGPIARYEYRIASQGHSDWELVKVSAKKDITDRHTLVDLHRISEEMDWAPDCRNNSLATNLYNVSVRAVTYDPANGRQFIGKWSRQTVQPNSCQKDNAWAIAWIVIGVISGFGLSIFIIFVSCNWGCRNKKVMNEVGMKMTPVLNGTTAVITENPSPPTNPPYMSAPGTPGPPSYKTTDSNTLDRGDGGGASGSLSSSATAGSSIKKPPIGQTSSANSEHTSGGGGKSTEKSHSNANQAPKGSRSNSVTKEGSVSKQIVRSGRETPRRNISGASDSTSGCESGRNYESRTEDSEEGSEQSMEQCLDQLQNLELNGHATSMGMSGYVPPMAAIPSTSTGYVAPPPLPPSAATKRPPSSNPAPSSGNNRPHLVQTSKSRQLSNGRLPKGYSQAVGVHPKQAQHSNANTHRQRAQPSKPSSGFEAFPSQMLLPPSSNKPSNSHSGRHRAKGASTDIQGFTLPPLPPPPPVTAPSGGYLSLADVQRNSAPPPPAGPPGKYLQAVAPQIGGGYVPHSQIQMQSQPFVSSSSHSIPPPSTSMVLRRSSSSSEEEEDEEDGDKTITPMGEDNPSQELLKKEKKASTSSSKSLLISPKALQESSSGVGGSFPSNKVNPSNSSIPPQSDPSQKYQLHHVVGSLNTGSMV